MSDLAAPPGSPPRGNTVMNHLRNLARSLGLGRNGEGTLREMIEEVIEEHREELDTPSIGADELKMLFNILKNGDLRIHEIMVPRVDVVAVSLEEPFETLIQTFVDAAHSRMPVYRGNLDEVVGMVHVKDALKLMRGHAGDGVAGEDGAGGDGGGLPKIDSILRPVLFVAPSMRAMDLLAKMRASRMHMAIVVDEYGGTDGLVSIEDLVEQIVGEIEDEHDAADPVMIKSIGEGRFDVDARLPVDELEEALGIELVGERVEDIDTVGGLVFSLAGRVPQIGERIRHPEQQIRFEVVDAEPRRIRRLRVSAVKPTLAAE